MGMIMIVAASITLVVLGNLALLLAMIVASRRRRHRSAPPLHQESPSDVQVEAQAVGGMPSSHARKLTPVPMPDDRSDVTGNVIVSMDDYQRTASKGTKSGPLRPITKRASTLRPMPKVLQERLDELNASRHEVQTTSRPLPMPLPPPGLEPLPELEPTEIMIERPDWAREWN